MPLPQLTFANNAPKPGAAPLRADVALFAGLIARRGAPLPAAQAAWLKDSEWVESDELDLLGAPIPVDSFAEFAAIFAWEKRPVEEGSAAQVSTRIGLAVRHFFSQGGARCFVLRTGDPLPLLAPDNEPVKDGKARHAALLDWHDGVRPADANTRIPLLPGFVDNANMPRPQEPETWRGVGQIFGLEEAIMLCLPDLPDLFAGPSQRLPETRTPHAGEEKFIACAPAISGVEPDENALRPDYTAPRLSLADYRDWSLAIRHALTMLEGSGSAAHRRDVMVLAALPLPDLSDPDMPADAQDWPLSLASAALPGPEGMEPQTLFSRDLVGSGRLQLAWPWLLAEDSSDQPEKAVGADGALAGTIARSTLARGLHRSATGLLAAPPRATLPDIPRRILQRSQVDGPYSWLGDCCCLFARRKGRMQLLSDVTTSGEDSWREGGASRIMGALLRQSALLGQELAFAPNGPDSWSKIRRSLEGLLEAFRANGALASFGRDPAYSVRCDASTMRRYDLDQGRLVAEVSFRPARTLQHIHVALDLRGMPA